DSYTSPSGNYTYTTSGVYYDTIPNHWGCDSLLTIDLTINYSKTGTDVITACDSYTWIDGNTYTESNNTAYYTIPGGAANGCDSTVYLNLTINTVDVTVTQNEESLTANALDATYQWLSCDEGNVPLSGETGQTFTPAQNGNYAVLVTQNGCTDTSSCYYVIVNLVENNFATTIWVIPNPTSGNVVIDLGGVYPAISVSITDQSGRNIRNIRGENVDRIEIYLNEPKGIYLLTIQDGKQRATVRIVKY
ncbi:MAG TPA: T9SS type A sorting domain-containing protein, partial [Tenuifilaceae bacterium]|nr:T9SS type A sorting domain-containing protein [Tenuifilaceae bacterium]